MLATLFGDGRDTGMRAQGIVISFGKSSTGLGDYGGGHDSPDSQQRAEDRNAAVLPWFVVLLTRRLKLVEQSFDGGTTTLALAVDWVSPSRGASFQLRLLSLHPLPDSLGHAAMTQYRRGRDSPKSRV